MKTLILYFFAILTFCLFFAGCFVNVTVQSLDTSDIPKTLKLISLAVLGIYEVVVRVVPSVKNYSVVAWLIAALKTVSDKLNITK